MLKEKKTERISYLDHIKWFLIVLVLAHHTAIGFGASGGWYYKIPLALSSSSFYWLTIFTAINQSFFMGFFFFISAFFTPLSFDKKGLFSFIKDKGVRLIIPSLIFFFIFSPLITAMASFFYHRPLTFHRGFGPTWFIVTLFVFNLFYAGFRCLYVPTRKRRLALPSHGIILLMSIVIGLLTFFTRLYWPVGSHWYGFQFGYFPMYIFLFVAGIMTLRHQWLQQLNLTYAKRWFINALISMVFIGFYINFIFSNQLNSEIMGGRHWYAFILTQWECFSCFSIIISLLALGKTYFNKTNDWFKALAVSSFAVYLIHPFIVLPVSYYEYQWLGFKGIIGWFLSCLLVIPLSFLIGYYLRRLPGVNLVL